MTENMLEMLLVFLGLMTVLGVVGKVALSIVNRGRSDRVRSGVSLDDIARQLVSLQQSVDTTAVEVERLGEAQRFTSKLLADKTVARSPFDELGK
jgi:hypothetical protein